MNYRDHLYRFYATARSNTLAPETVAGLAPRAAYLQRLICHYFPTDKDAAIVDLGCGHGALVYFARRAGYRHIIGFDRSPEQVWAASRLGIEEVRLGDLFEALHSLADGSQDMVIAFDVIEHFQRQELVPFAQAVCRVLRPGGRWIVHTPNGESPFVGRIRYGDLTHELAFTRESFSQLCLSCGFSQVRCYEDAPVVHGTTSAARYLAWKVIRGFLRFYLAAETGDTSRSAIFSQNLLAVAVK